MKTIVSIIGLTFLVLGGAFLAFRGRQSSRIVVKPDGPSRLEQSAGASLLGAAKSQAEQGSLKVVSPVDTPEDIFSIQRRRMLLDRTKYVQQARLRVEGRQGKLFQRLKDIPAETLSQLKDLMAAEEVDLALIALPQKKNETREEEQTRIAQMAALNTKNAAAIQVLLGAEDYAKYTAYQQSLAYESTVDEITNIMRARGANVSGEQQDAILDAYANAIRNAAAISANEASPETLASMTDLQRLNLKNAQLARFDENLSVELAQVMSPNALQRFMAAEFEHEVEP